MTDLVSSFQNAWARFQAGHSLRLAGDVLEWEWTRGRADARRLVLGRTRRDVLPVAFRRDVPAYEDEGDQPCRSQ